MPPGTQRQCHINVISAQQCVINSSRQSFKARHQSPAKINALKNPKSLLLLDCDHSILVFNECVLACACRADVPLLERLRYL